MDQRGMTFNDDALEVPEAFRDGRVIRDRDGPGIEEAAVVVKLEMACGGKPLQSVVDLVGDRSQRNGARECVPPEIALNVDVVRAPKNAA